jgi:uncharacterized Zn finger protein (UPF0148 family)
MVEVRGSKVKFDCPRCGTRLVSKLSQAGGIDTCPTCMSQFKTPGTQARKDWEDQRRHEQELKDIRRDKKAEKRQRREEIRREKNASKYRVNNHQKMFNEKKDTLDGTYANAKACLVFIMVIAFLGGAAGWTPLMAAAAYGGHTGWFVGLGCVALLSGFLALMVPFIAYAVASSVFRIEKNTRN